MPDRYENPLTTRYASPEMQYIFSEDYKFTTWRKLWIALAQSQKELGLDITDEQITEMQTNVSDINYEVARKREKEIRHDVMSHIYAYGLQCPLAKPIIHLGATSCYVGDNTDMIQQRQALQLIRRMLIEAMYKVSQFAKRYASLPCLAFTHFQAAQPTTVGKRATLWLQDLCFDLEQLDFVLNNLKFPGCKGTTGTGASFLTLFNGDHQKVKELEKLIATKMNFTSIYPISGQTYSRKIDDFILHVLSGIAQSAAKFSNDIRLLSHLKEVEEPYEQEQVGSSAMAYKRNPMRSERIASLARYAILAAQNPALTASTQWFERTLDDSANRRICLPETFLAIDAILQLYINISDGLIVHPYVIARHLNEELPFMATENILMHSVKLGGDRQLLHEQIRKHSVAAGVVVKDEGKDNDLVERILADPTFAISLDELNELMQPEKFIGRAKEQTNEFLVSLEPLFELHKDQLGLKININV